MSQFNLKDAIVKIKDGGANVLVIKMGDGTLNHTEYRAREYTTDAGRLDEVRDGDDQPMDVNLTGTFAKYGGNSSTATTPTITEALNQTGAASGWTSTDADDCRPYSVDIEVIHTPRCGDVETITFPDFRHESLAVDYKAGTIAITGKCNVLAPNSVLS